MTQTAMLLLMKPRGFGLLQSKWVSKVDRIAWLVILVGALVRVIQYRFNRSLWADEASLALNIVNRSYGELLHPLDYDQGAPIGFLWIEKFATQLFGTNEYSLRLFPLIGGLVTLVLLYQIIRQYSSGLPILVALGLVCFLPPFIYFSTEVKQYSTDVAATLGCFWVVKQSEYPSFFNRQWVVLALCGASLIWLSHPAVFVLAGAVLGLGFKSWISKQAFAITPNLVKRLVVYLSWLMSFGVFYVVSIQELGANQQLKSSWQAKDAFPSSANVVENLVWVLDRLGRFFYSPLGFSGPWDGVAIALFLIGCVAIYLQKRGELYLLLSPLLLTIVAAFLKKYPFEGRLIFFLSPLFLILIAVGIGQFMTARRRWLHSLGPLLGVLLLVQPLRQSLPLLYTPTHIEEIRPVLDYVQTHRQANDSLYIYQRGNLQFLFYAERYGYSPEDYILGIDDLDHLDGFGISAQEQERYYRDLTKLRGRDRVWVLFSHAIVPQENDLVLNYLNCFGKSLDFFQAEGAFIYLYDLSDTTRECPQ